MKARFSLLGNARNVVIQFDDRGKFIRVITRGELSNQLDSCSARLKEFEDRFTVHIPLVAFIPGFSPEASRKGALKISR